MLPSNWALGKWLHRRPWRPSMPPGTGHVAGELDKRPCVTAVDPDRFSVWRPRAEHMIYIYGKLCRILGRSTDIGHQIDVVILVDTGSGAVRSQLASIQSWQLHWTRRRIVVHIPHLIMRSLPPTYKYKSFRVLGVLPSSMLSWPFENSSYARHNMTRRHGRAIQFAA